MQDLQKHFGKAKLPLLVTEKPFARGRDTDQIFQMTIEGNKPEQFKIFPGVGSEVRVLDSDKNRKQVLLFVKEPKRVFKTKRYDYKLKKQVEDVHETPSDARRYLAGMDERHLFISELPREKGKINTVDDAHRWLKPEAIKDRKKRKGSKLTRQGEWFFIEVNPDEQAMIDERPLAILENTALPTRGKPHRCQYYLKIGEVFFVKGTVRHADHATVEFMEWRRVYRNTEPAAPPRSVHGWID